MAEVALVIPFSLNPQTGAFVTTTDQDIIWKNRVRMAVQTAFGERVMRPSYGTKISEAAFNTITGFEDTVQNEVRRIFIEQLPLLDLTEVTAIHNEKDNKLTCEITYMLPNKTDSTVSVGVMVVSDINPPYEELNQ